MKKFDGWVNYYQPSFTSEIKKRRREKDKVLRTEWAGNCLNNNFKMVIYRG